MKRSTAPGVQPELDAALAAAGYSRDDLAYAFHREYSSAATVAFTAVEATSRKNRRAAIQRVSAARENGERLDRGIHEMAGAYRRRHPYDRTEHSTRALALHIATKTGRPAETIRRRLIALKLK